jgi:lipopolysaccharide biosynthesis glycosyltransferase
MNIVCASDDNFIPHCLVMLKSLLANNSGLRVWLISDGLSANVKKLVEDRIKSYGGSIEVLEISNEMYSKFPMPKNSLNGHISRATYLRLFIGELLPKAINKVIYLDSDIIIRKSIHDLWTIDLEGFAMAGVRQIYNEDLDRLRLNIPPTYGYINAGVLLINLDYVRKIDFLTICIDYMDKYSDCVLHHDQDVLNALFYKETKYISPNWNATTLIFHPLVFFKKIKFLKGWLGISARWSDFEKIRRDPSIVHYTSYPKPWNGFSKHPFANDYIFFSDESMRCLTLKNMWAYYHMKVVHNVNQTVKWVWNLAFRPILNISKIFR